jgi:hypothetical protein
LQNSFFFSFSDIEAKHLQLSTDQLKKSPTDYPSSTENLENDKSSSTNTSLNSTSSSSLSNRNSSKIGKINRLIKQQKSSPINQPIIDDYSSYNPNEHYYSNLSLYPSNESIYYDQKRKHIDGGHHHHHHLFDYETNLSSEKFDFYSQTNNYYQNEHPYHHTSVIVDSQQYFLNGWNGTTAF